MLAFISISKVNAQCPDTETIISTNPETPQNNQFQTVFPGLINPLINTFNWSGFAPGLGFTNIELNPNAGWDPGVSNFSMSSPFSMAMPPDYNYLTMINGGPPIISQMADMDWPWQSGWELMWLNTGYYPDGQEINNPNPNIIPMASSSLIADKVPFYILYNRYTGKMRLFANLIVPFGSTNFIYSHFSYNPGFNGSSIFRSIGNYDRPLDLPTINWKATVYNKHDNNPNIWYSNDVQLSYDPCVCEYNSSFNFSLDAIQTFNIDLYGREIQVQVPINLVENDYLTQSSVEANSLSGNNLIYKYTDKLYADYQQQLTDYNTKLKDYNSFGNSLKSMALGLAKDVATGTVASVFPTAALKSLIVKNAVTLSGKPFPDTTTADGWSKAAKEASKSLVGKGFDYLSQSFVTSKPTKPTMPTATLSEMRLSGNIDQQNPITLGMFHTPGSFKVGQHPNSLRYPIYNKPVGFFALLQKPELDFYVKREYLPTQVIDTGRCINSYFAPWEIGETIGLSYDTTYGQLKRKLFKAKSELYLKLKSPLVYKYNDAANIDKNRTQTFVSFIVEYDANYQHINVYNSPNSPLIYGHSIDTPKHRVLSGNMELIHDFRDLNNPNLQTRVYESEWTNMKDLNQMTFGLEFLDSIINTTSGMVNGAGVPCNFLHENLLRSYWPVNIKTVKMKIMCDMYFTTDEDINTTQVFTYNIYDRIYPQNQTSSLTQHEGTSALKKYTLGTLNLGNEYINASHPAVTSTSGSILYIDAEEVIINGDLAADPAYSVEINAMKNISVIAGASVGPEISLKVKKDYFSTPLFNEALVDDLSAYCAGSNKRYNANTLLTKTEMNETLAKKVIEEPHIKALIYPNPANSAIHLSLPGKNACKIFLFDLVGKQISVTEVTNDNKAMVDVSSLQNGIYVIQIVSDAFTQSQKVIIRH